MMMQGTATQSTTQSIAFAAIESKDPSIHHSFINTNNFYMYICVFLFFWYNKFYFLIKNVI
jgi:hypothetical protein